MRIKSLFILLLTALVLFIAGCGSSVTPASTSEELHNYVEVSFTFNHTKTIASNQYAVWIEDGDGSIVKTLFVTKFTVKGGWKDRPDAIPLWVEKSGIANGDIDANSGATPKSGQLTYIWDCTDDSGQAVPAGDYRFIVEGTIFWKDAVTYTGTIKVGGDENTAPAEASYTTEEAKKSDMITDVTAIYKP